MTHAEVRIHGDEDLTRGLARLDDYLDEEVRRTNMQVAQDIAREAAAAASGLGSTAAHVAPSIQAHDLGASAEVALGGGGYPMAAGAEFGATQYPQFSPWRGSGEDGGYFLYPTVRRREDETDEAYLDAADTSLRKAGFR